MYCLFRDVSELSQTVDYFEKIIAAIESLGLKLSPSKSCVVTRGKGPGYEKWKRTNTAVDASKTHHLLLREGALKIPLKKKSMYLGTFLSYDQFERQSVELRVQAGWNNFKRLQPWLCRKHKISLQLSLELIGTCIIPTICYGIFSLACNTMVFNLCVKHYTRCTGELLAISLIVQGKLTPLFLRDSISSRH